MQVHALHSALLEYCSVNGYYPSNLNVLVVDGKRARWEHFLKRGTGRDMLRDAWGQPFVYRVDGRKYTLISLGRDGQIGTADDLAYIRSDRTGDPLRVTVRSTGPLALTNTP